MGKIKEILKYSAAGLSQRETAAATGASLGTVNTVLSRIKEANIKDPLALKEHELGAIVYPTPRITGGHTRAGKRPEPDMDFIQHELQRPGVTLNLLWEEYKAVHPDGYGRSQFCARYVKFRKENEVYMRKVYKAGDQMMVDWVGMTMQYTDRKGDSHKVYFFVAILPATSLIYAEPFLDMRMESWIEAHINAFEYFGGVPRLLIPDNLKNAVSRVSRHESELNKTYVEMARYYGTAVLPARPYEPRDKGPVENAVKIVEYKIIAMLRDRQFHSFSELRKEVMVALERVNTMAFQKLPYSRKELFEKTEKQTLKALPPSRYEMAVFKMAKVNFDYHVQYEGFYYSVPFHYAHKQVEIRATTHTIEVLCETERIAAHLRNYDPSKRYTTCFDHMPKKHQAMADWTPERFRNWAAKIGPDTEAYIVSLMEARDQPEQAFRTCTAILHLADTAPAQDMEKAAKQAKQMRAYSYKSFEILLKRIGRETLAPIQHENIRGAHYYGEDNRA
ncbi:integrase [Spirochaetia bacterium]|nr:integrase [Spirochaetia bacterium]